jgi:hypothetical protein
VKRNIADCQAFADKQWIQKLSYILLPQPSAASALEIGLALKRREVVFEHERG